MLPTFLVAFELWYPRGISCYVCMFIDKLLMNVFLSMVTGWYSALLSRPAHTRAAVHEPAVPDEPARALWAVPARIVPGKMQIFIPINTKLQI